MKAPLMFSYAMKSILRFISILMWHFISDLESTEIRQYSTQKAVLDNKAPQSTSHSEILVRKVILWFSRDRQYIIHLNILQLTKVVDAQFYYQHLNCVHKRLHLSMRKLLFSPIGNYFETLLVCFIARNDYYLLRSLQNAFKWKNPRNANHGYFPYNNILKVTKSY